LSSGYVELEMDDDRPYRRHSYHKNKYKKHKYKYKKKHNKQGNKQRNKQGLLGDDKDNGRHNRGRGNGRN